MTLATLLQRPQSANYLRIGGAFLLGALFGPYGNGLDRLTFILTGSLLLFLVVYLRWQDTQRLPSPSSVLLRIRPVVLTGLIMAVVIGLGSVLLSLPEFTASGSPLTIIAGFVAPLFVGVVSTYIVWGDLPRKRILAGLCGSFAWLGAGIHTLIPLGNSVFFNADTQDLQGFGIAILVLLLIAILIGIPFAVLGGIIGSKLRRDL